MHPAAKALILVVVFAAGFLFGHKTGVDSVKADQLEHAVDVDQDKEAAADTSSDVGAKTSARGNAQQSKTEEATNASQGRIRTVYRTVVVPGDCTFPDGVRREIDQGIDEANRAVRAAARAGTVDVPDR